MPEAHRVVVIGGGFGGLHAVQALKRAPVQITLLDRRNFHLFQPLLYQVATGALSPGEIASPLRSILKRQQNAQVLLAEVTDLDVANRQVILSQKSVPYDTLIVATGARHHYFGHDEWEPLAPGLKTVEDALTIRRRILLAFEAAEVETDPERRRALLTFVVVGGGPTGVELAGALGEIANHTLRYDFRAINPRDAQIVLLEGADRILPPYPTKLSARATADLVRLGVIVRSGAIVTKVEPGRVTYRVGQQEQSLSTETVLWAAGVMASPLGRKLAAQTGTESDRAGRLIVGPDLSLPGHQEIFVIGDLAHFSHQTSQPLPGVAPVAMQQGRYVGKLIARRLRGEAASPFRYKDRGNMATIGRAAAVADLGRIQLSGVLGWLAWLFIHLLYLVGFENRVTVLVQWAWTYFTRGRSARLITGRDE